jgi:hypothetical protein
MDHPVLFLTDGAGKRTGVIIALKYYDALLKRLADLRERPKVSNPEQPAASPEDTADGNVRTQ